MRTYKYLMDSINESESAIRKGERYALAGACYWLAKWETAVISNGETVAAIHLINQWLENHGEKPAGDLYIATLKVTFVLTDIYKEVNS